LHLGHVRNILLGWSCSKILEAAGNEVIKVQIVNDRGIAICKSMLAWQEYGNGATPESTGIKSDHFVGEYYVLFEKKFKAEYIQWQSSKVGQEVYHQQSKDNESQDSFFKRYKNEYFNSFSILGRKAKNMLLLWEAEDTSTRALWNRMNGWVYAGFDKTYEALRVEFDQLYFESETYLLGKKSIEFGLDKKLFYRADDGSVWIDLEEEGYDQKILLRSDGTSVYMTQDIGTAMQRYKDHQPESMVYVVADEQDYHFKVLFEILKKLDQPYANKLHHLSYGMVELPDGKMKSREGTVVDADDLIAEVIREARQSAEERGDLPGETPEEQSSIVKKIALGAIKFFILKVTPKKRMIFNPSDSLDMQGQTGPYIQNAYVRIRSILRRVEYNEALSNNWEYAISNDEKEIIKQLAEYPSIISESANNYDPSSLANYNYQLAKSFHKFYHDYRIIGAETEGAKSFRLLLINCVAKVLKSSMELLGIEMPERM
jgi:arginyl-tRNA synthetase